MVKPSAAPTPKVDPAHYNRIVSHAKIRDIRLIGCKLDLKPDAVELTDRVWSYNLSDQLDDWTCDNEKGRLIGLYSYSASCREGRRTLLSVTGRYLSIYNLSSLCDEQAGRLFLARVGRFAAYPYFRSIFASLTQQGGLTLPPLPVISDGPRWVNSPAEVAKLDATTADKTALPSTGDA